jgi:hypothetical protein
VDDSGDGGLWATIAYQLRFMLLPKHLEWTDLTNEGSGSSLALINFVPDIHHSNNPHNAKTYYNAVPHKRAEFQ